MRRRGRTVVAALALAAAVATVSAASGRPAAAFPTRLQAVADEFNLTLSRTAVPNKRLRIELVNFGEDPHDFRLRRFGGTRTFVIPETLPGEHRARTFRLRPGRYRVWCSVDGHREWGMRATLRVRR